MNRIIISTESGADLPYKIIIPNNIETVPMHVTFGDRTLCDGSFDVREIDDYFRNSKTLPTTSAVNPEEFTKHFKAIFQKYPNCNIIHISYSSKLSASYQNAVIASHDFKSDRLSIIDSENASIGVGALVIKACEIVRKYGNVVTFEECVSLINKQRDCVCCSFVPDKLDYLKAGGRISGIAHLGATVLNLKPSIVVENGQLVAGKKYRGNINKIAQTYLEDFKNHNSLSKEFIVIAYTYDVNKALLFSLKRHAHKLGFAKSWCFQLGSAVTSHTGPVGIGFAGVSRRDAVTMRGDRAVWL